MNTTTSTPSGPLAIARAVVRPRGVYREIDLWQHATRVAIIARRRLQMPDGAVIESAHARLLVNGRGFWGLREASGLTDADLVRAASSALGSAQRTHARACCGTAART